jgi:hypothetical protein
MIGHVSEMVSGSARREGYATYLDYPAQVVGWQGSV